MQQLLLITIAAAVLCCAMLAPAFKSSLLRPRDLPRRLVILPVGGDCERLEARLIYERDRARREGNAVLFLLERKPAKSPGTSAAANRTCSAGMRPDCARQSATTLFTKWLKLYYTKLI